MRGPAWSIFGTVGIVLGVLGLASDGAAQARIDAKHRAALERFLRASRTLAVIRHAGVPAMIAATAVNGWGFGLSDLRVAEIVSHLDGKALEDRIVEIHARYLTADQATGAAAFYESPASTRILGDVLRGSLPATDPLVREDVAPPTEADRRAFQGFSEGTVGAHVRVVTPLINEEVLRAVDEAADRAVERYVAQNALPHRRLQPRPPEGRR